MIDTNISNKTILFVILTTINEIQSDHILRKRQIVIEQLEIKNTEEITQWNQWPTGQNRSLRNYTQIPKCTEKERNEGKCNHKCLPVDRKVGYKCTRGRLGQKIDTIFALGGSWIKERNVLFGEDASEKYCMLQCLATHDCEHTTSINVWSIGGQDPVDDPILYSLVQKLEKLEPRINGTWQNVTVCTLYRSCQVIAQYQYPKEYCEDCKIVYNHCPWFADFQEANREIMNRSCGEYIKSFKLGLSIAIYLILFCINY